MSNIDDLEQDGQRLKVSWRKAHNYFHSFTKLFFEMRNKFANEDFGDDKYGVPWDFNSWLGFKAGLIETQVMRRIDLFGKQLAQDDRDNIAAAKKAEADKKRQEADARRKEREEKAAQKKAEQEAQAAIKAEEEAVKKQQERRSRLPSGTANRNQRIAKCGYLSEVLQEDIKARRLSVNAADDIARAPEAERDALREKFLADPSRRPRNKPPSVKVIKVTDELAVEICAGYAEAQRGKENWINGHMRAAVALVKAREEHTADQEFSRWLKAHPEIPYTDHDRAALIKFGQHPEKAREVLGNTSRFSLREIERLELRPLLEERFDRTVKPEFNGGSDFPVIH